MKITDKERLDWLRKNRHPMEIKPYGFYVVLLGPFKTDIDAIDAAIRASKRGGRK